MDLPPTFHYRKVGYTADGARLFPEVQGERTRCWSQVAASETAAGYKEAVLHRESGEALEQVAQRGCSVSIPEFFQKFVYVTSSVAPPLKSFSLIQGDEDLLDRKKISLWKEGENFVPVTFSFCMYLCLVVCSWSFLVQYNSSIHGASKIYHVLAQNAQNLIVSELVLLIHFKGC